MTFRDFYQVWMESMNKNHTYHITRASSMESIRREGLKPSVPVDMDTEEEGVYLFKTKEDAEDALSNWLGDRFDEDEELVMLTVDISDLRVFSTLADYEYVCYEIIPSENIVEVEEV